MPRPQTAWLPCRQYDDWDFDLSARWVRSPPYWANCHVWACDGCPTVPPGGGPPEVRRFRRVRRYCVSIQIVHNQSHLNGLGVALLKHLFDLLRPIFPGTAFSNRHMTLAGQGLNFHEDFGHTVSGVFVVHPLRLPRLAGCRGVDFADHLLAGLIHAHHWIRGVIRQMVDLPEHPPLPLRRLRSLVAGFSSICWGEA